MKALGISLLACLSFAAANAGAQTRPPTRQPDAKVPVAKEPAIDTTQQLTIYGFGQGDYIYDFGQNNPNWFDTNRPTKLPAFDEEFGEPNRSWLSVRQSRFGVKGTKPTEHGDVTAQFEFDMFGVGVDQGQTTIRLRYAWGQWGPVGAGQTVSPFMDLDIFPNVLDYWGPNGMLFFRNVLVFYQPINNENARFTIAAERPGASGDAGIYSDRVELQNIVARFPAPDFSAEYRWSRPKWGYVELAGIVRTIRWDDVLIDTLNLAGGTTGWGGSLSSNIWNKSKTNILRLQAVYGAGVENYFNDAPVDIGIVNNLTVRNRPIFGRALPDLGLVAYLDHTWNSKWTSALGWSMVNIENTDAQLPSAFHQGQYASVNGIYTPVPQVMMGAELQYARRENFSDDFSFDDVRIQLSFKYSFSKQFGGK